MPDPELAQQRLEQIFPRGAFDTTLFNPLAAKAAVALIFIDAVVVDDADLAGPEVRLAAPRQCLWLSQQLLSASPQQRLAWYIASAKNHATVVELENTWGFIHQAWASDNSREPLRDETFHEWRGHEAIRVRHEIPTNSARGRWALAASFADLFDPAVSGAELDTAIEQWREDHMEPNARFRAQTRMRRERAAAGVEVALPGGQIRTLEPGESSLILKGVIEEWAIRRLDDPEVLALSQPGDKLPDRGRLTDLGVAIDVGSLLPDALIVDIGPKVPEFWIVAVVASDGPITEDRRQQLLRWASDQNIDTDSCRFLTAFSGRNSPPTRRRLKDLAVGTYAWFADEPDRELAWYHISG